MARGTKPITALLLAGLCVLIVIGAFAAGYSGWQEVVDDRKNAIGKTVTFRYKALMISADRAVDDRDSASAPVTDCGNRTKFFWHVEQGSVIVKVYYTDSQLGTVQQIDNGDVVTCTVCQAKKDYACKL